MRYLTLFSVLTLIVSACTFAVPAEAPTDVPLTESVATGGLSVRLVEHTGLATAYYLDEGETNPDSGTQYYAVALEFETAGEPYTVMLSLDTVILKASDGSSYPALTITVGPGEDATISDLGFFKRAGGDDGRTLDFGVGFTGNDLTMSQVYAEGKRAGLTVYHGENLMHLTFLFQLPASTTPVSIQFQDSAPLPLQ